MRRLLGLLLISACWVKAQQLQVQDAEIPVLTVDKAGNGSITLTFKGTAPLTRPLELSADFTHMPPAPPNPPPPKPYHLNSKLDAVGATPDDVTLLKNPLADKAVRVKLNFSGILQGGESSAPLLNSGTPVIDKDSKAVVLTALLFPADYNVQLDPQSAEVTFGPGVVPYVRLHNADPISYTLDWEIHSPERPVASGKSPFILPANGTVDVSLASAGVGTSLFGGGTLKDEVLDGNLVLKHQTGTLDIPPQPPKSLPLKLRLKYFSSTWQEVSAFFWTLLLLVVGAVASLAFRLYIPNAQTAYRLRRRARDLRHKVDGAGDDLPSQWRVLLIARLQSCCDPLYQNIWATPGFTTILGEVQKNLDLYEQWVAIAYGVSIVFGQTRLRAQSGIPPTLFRRIQRKCNQALDPIASGFTTDDELQSMKAALKQAQLYASSITDGAQIADFETTIKEREDRIGKLLDTLRSSFPQFECLIQQFREKTADPISPANYFDRDLLSYKIDLLRQYREIRMQAGCDECPAAPAPVQPGAQGATPAVASDPRSAPPAAPAPPNPQQGAGPAQVAGSQAPPEAGPQSDRPPAPQNSKEDESACDRLDAHQKRLFANLIPGSNQSLEVADLLVEEMRQDFYPAALDEEVKDGLEIHVHPSAPSGEPDTGANLLVERLVPLQFSLRFKREPLNGVASLREWICYWTFGDGSEEETGWDAYHRYTNRLTQEYDVTVTLVDLDGNKRGEIIRKVQVRMPRGETIRPSWVSKRVPAPSAFSPEGKIEFWRFAFTMAIALAGIFATARSKVEPLDVFQAAGVVFGLGFAAETVKNLLTPDSGKKE